METSIHPLRAKARDVLSGASLKLAKLAVLDAALDQILLNHESKLLATVPALLKRRFEYVRKQHQLSRADDRQADDPVTWMQPDGWLADFFKVLNGALLAELDVRLQPTLGLIEAFGNEAVKYK